MTINPHDIKKARDGDKEAFGALYEVVSRDLYKVALYTLGNPQDAEDAVSDTFVEAFKGLKNLRDENSFVPWIFKILSIRCKRKMSGYVKERGNIDIDDYIAGDPASAAVGDNSLRAELKDVLWKLKPDEREIIILSVTEGFTMRETAEIMGLPQGTVSSKLHRTLKKLRIMLTD